MSSFVLRSGLLAALATLLAGCAAEVASDAPDGGRTVEAEAGSDTEPTQRTQSLRLDAANGDTVRPSDQTRSPAQPMVQVASNEPYSRRIAEQHAHRTPNEYGRIPILEYHLVVDEDGSYAVSRDRFRSELDTLYALGYRPIGLDELLDQRIPLPRGLSPVVFVFDDASPSQFRYVLNADSTLSIDPTSALGLWLEFARDKPDWRNRGVFCLLSGAEAGRSFFGNKGIEGQATAWRFRKLQQLDSLGFDLCNHTLWHARLDKYPDAFVQEQIARGALAIDSAMPGYRIRGFALPLGMWPKNRALAFEGQWTDPASGRTTAYRYDAVFEVAGGPARSPYDPKFNPRALPRIPLGRNMPLLPTLRSLERDSARGRYVSDGDPGVISGRTPP
jgi:hypothetical protein